MLPSAHRDSVPIMTTTAANGHPPGRDSHDLSQTLSPRERLAGPGDASHYLSSCILQAPAAVSFAEAVGCVLLEKLPAKAAEAATE